MTDVATVDSTPDDGQPPLGANYWRLWSASVVSNTGDGISAVALPLLAESLTRDPLLFAGVAVAQRLPWLLFALQAGAIADRMDRRRLMWTSNAVRCVLMAALGVAVLGDVDSIWLLYAVSLALGVAETLFDNASQAILPAIVTDPDGLERANGRLFAGEIVTNQFVGPPLGGFLFGIAAAVPILVDAGTFAISAGLILAMTGSFVTRRRSAVDAPDADAAGDAAVAPTPGAGTGTTTSAPRTRMRDEIREGLTWLWQHRLLRTLAVLLGVLNGTAMMAFAIFPLYAIGEDSVLGLGPVGFSLLLTSGAVGSVAGSLGAERFVARFGRGPTLWVTLASGVAVPLSIGLTSSIAVVVAANIVFGFTSVVWNVVTVSLRQTIIPDDLLGRVNSVYRFLGWGMMPLGSLLGGAVAAVGGIRAPFLLAAGLSLLAMLPVTRIITSREIDAARAGAVR